MRKLTIIVVSATGLSFAGCDVNVDGGRNVAVLAPGSVVLTEKAVELKSPKVMKVVGPLFSVCFVLKNGVPFQEMGVMNGIFKDAMGGAQIEVVGEPYRTVAADVEFVFNPCRCPRRRGTGGLC